MTDTARLRACIEKKGFKLKFVAKVLGLSPYTLSMKIENDSEFKVSEVDALAELLDLSLIEKDEIFFCH
nr:helix-turn-helix transcriptional regulator [uncultured Gemmiger sp.]